MKKGVFVVIESSDGSDKSDLATRVVDMLMDEGRKVRTFHPGTLMGEIVEHSSNSKGLESHAEYLLSCASIYGNWLQISSLHSTQAQMFSWDITYSVL